MSVRGGVREEEASTTLKPGMALGGWGGSKEGLLALDLPRDVLSGSCSFKLPCGALRLQRALLKVSWACFSGASIAFIHYWKSQD